MKFRQCRMFVLWATISLVLAACGQVQPAFSGGSSFASPTQEATSSASPATSATPFASPTPVDPFSASPTPATTLSASPTSTPTARWIELPADFAIRTAEQAETLAVAAAQDMFAAPQPHVANTWLVTQREAWKAEDADGGENDDPLALVWWVDLDGAQFRIPRCPAPPAGVTQTSCGTSPIASMRIFARTGGGQGLGLGRRFTPATESGSVSIPSSARLRTEGEAIAAGFLNVPGIDGHAPKLANIRLMSLQQWLHEQAEQGSEPFLGLDPATPIWELEFVQAAFVQPCPLLDTSQCIHDHIFIALNAQDVNSIGYYGKPDTPTTPTPGATPVP
jgi:hypothetical protein